MPEVHTASIGADGDQFTVLPRPDVVFPQPGDIEDRFVGAEYARQQPCLFFALLGNPGQRGQIVFRLLFPLGVEDVIGVHADFLHGDAVDHRLKAPAGVQRKDLLIVDVHALPA